MPTKKIFDGLGPGTLIPQRGTLPDQLGPEAGFVLSRVDGRTTLEEICLLVPFDEPLTMIILRQLWELGAIEVPGVARTMAPPAVHPVVSARPSDSPPITAAQRRRIDDFYAGLDTRDAFQLLEIDRTADDKGVKRAYFKLSKEFHPDRFFGKDIGEDKERLSKIFQAIKAAFEVLSDGRRRAAYEEAAGLK